MDSADRSSLPRSSTFSAIPQQSPFHLLNESIDASARKIKEKLGMINFCWFVILINLLGDDMLGDSASTLSVAMGNFLLVLFLGCVWLVYMIMEPFVKPIAWALIVGGALFPVKAFLKKRLVVFFKSPKIMGQSVLCVPGDVSHWIIRWIWSNLYELILLVLIFLTSYGVEWAWDVALNGISFVPMIFQHFMGIVDTWSLLTASSFFYVVLVCALVGPLLFFFLRNHPFAMQIVSYMVWLLIVAWFIPTLYSFFPKLTFVCASIPFLFTLFGFLNKSSSVDPSSENTIGRRKKKRFRTSSRLVSYLFIGCLSVFLLNYLVYVAAWIVLLSRVNDIASYLLGKLKVSDNVLNVMFPPFLSLLLKWFRKGDDSVKRYFLKHVDSVATLFTVFLFIAFAIAVPSYFTVQIYDEGRDIAENVQTLWKSKSDFIPASMNETVSELVSSGVDWLDGRIFNNTGIRLSDWNYTSFKLSIAEAPEVNFTKLADSADFEGIISNNLSILYAIKDNGQILLNFALYSVYSILSTTTSMLFGVVVFMSVLFYMLAASTEDQYQPLIWMKLGSTTIDSSLVAAIEDIFHSTIMLATFHALFTWVSFTLLQAKWVYISTVLSFVFSLLPFFSAYWISIPASIELYYDRENMGPALVLAISHILVYWFVDPLIYSEVKGVHPYVTTLSVVGGLYLMGIEGILLGPYFLILVVVLTEFVRKNAKGNQKEDQGQANALETPVFIKKSKKKQLKRD